MTEIISSSRQSKFTKELSSCQILGFFIPISLQPDVEDLWYFKLGILFSQFLITKGCKDNGIRKLEFVAGAQFLWFKFHFFDVNFIS